MNGGPTGRQFLFSVALAVPLCLCRVSSGQAVTPKVAVADFGYEDTSGEVQNEASEHASRLANLKASVVNALAGSGHFRAVGLACAHPPCSAENLDQTDMVEAGRDQGARYVVFGGVHKMSTLIQWGRVDVMDTATGKSVLSRTLSFRGDSADAWTHAASYIGQMLAQDLK